MNKAELIAFLQELPDDKFLDVQARFEIFHRVDAISRFARPKTSTESQLILSIGTDCSLGNMARTFLDKGLRTEININRSY